jgi:hypothetical protein
LDSRLQLGDHARPHPGDGALADAEHVGDHRLALALDQEPHQLLLPQIEAHHRPGEELLVLIVQLIGSQAGRRDARRLRQSRRRHVVERGERSLPPRLSSATPGDVDGPVMSQPLQKGAAVIRVGAAARVEWRDRRLTVGRARQPPQVVKDERHCVVEGRWITNAPLAEHAADHDRHNRLGGMDQVFEHDMTASVLPLAQQTLQIGSPRSYTAMIRMSDLIHEHAILW